MFSQPQEGLPGGARMVTDLHLSAECETESLAGVRLPVEDEYENDEENDFQESVSNILGLESGA